MTGTSIPLSSLNAGRDLCGLLAFIYLYIVQPSGVLSLAATGTMAWYFQPTGTMTTVPTSGGNSK